MSSFDYYEEKEYLKILDYLTDIDYKTTLLIKHLTVIYEKDRRMAFDIAMIVAAAQREKDLVASVKAAFAAQNAKLTDLSNQIAALTANQMDENTKAQLQAVADQLNASNVDLDSLANAVVANTPAANGNGGTTGSDSSVTDTTSTVPVTPSTPAAPAAPTTGTATGSNTADANTTNPTGTSA